MDNETKDYLIALTDVVAAATQNAYYAHEMAHSLYRVVSKDHPLEFREAYQKASLELDQLIQERGELMQKLALLGQRLKEK